MRDVSGFNEGEMCFILIWFGVHQSILRSWGDISVLLVLWQCCWGLSILQSSKSRLLMCLIGKTQLLCIKIKKENVGKEKMWRSFLPFGMHWRSFHRREHSPINQQKIGLKIYWTWPGPSEQDPDSPIVSLSHQEASISLLSLPIRGQTDWKPPSQKTNQSDHMDHSLL